MGLSSINRLVLGLVISLKQTVSIAFTLVPKCYKSFGDPLKKHFIILNSQLKLFQYINNK